MKSTEKRDLYAMELERYRAEVPMSEWPRYGRSLSKSGLATALQARGLPSFDRKRLESAKCLPIFKAMARELANWLATQVPVDAEENTPPEPTSARISSTEKRLMRQIERLERELRNAERREQQYKQRCALLEAELEAVERQHDAFEQHCHRSLRTLHV